MELENAGVGPASGAEDEDEDEDVIAEGDFDLMDEGSGSEAPDVDDFAESDDGSKE